MKSLPAIVQGNKVKKIRRHGRHRRSHKSSKVFSHTKHGERFSKSFYASSATDNFDPITTNSYVSFGDIKSQVNPVSAKDVSRSEIQSTARGKSLQRSATTTKSDKESISMSSLNRSNIILPTSKMSSIPDNSKKILTSSNDSDIFNPRKKSKYKIDTKRCIHLREYIWYGKSNNFIVHRDNRIICKICDQEEKKKKKRRRRGLCGFLCCPCCSPCCCLTTGLLIALLLIGLALLIGLLIVTRTKATTSTTTTTTTTSSSTSTTTTTVTTTTTTTTTTTSVTTTTTSTSTSSTTSSTSTSTTSTSSTSSTSTSTTSTSSTSSTSTSTTSTSSTSSTSTSTTSETTTSTTSETTTSTTSVSTTSSTSTTSETTTSTTSVSTTSSTSTTSVSTTSSTSATTTSTSTTTTFITTVTTTTTAATVTITSNVCTSGWKGVNVLYHVVNAPNISPFVQYTYTYTAISNRTRIAFAFREDTGCFVLDNVSVRSVTAPGVELIANNDFETGTLSSWTYCNPQGATAAGEVKANSDNLQCAIYTLYAKSGTHYYYDGAVGACDYLIQTFATTVGATYTVSFWLFNDSAGPPNSADLIMSF